MTTLRLWRRRRHVAWFAAGRPFPDWVFASVTGTALDESNVRKGLNRILDGAGVHRRGQHQMRHTFASLLLQNGVPITYVAAQLGHSDPSITLRVYSHWLPDASRDRLVDRLDETLADAPQAHPPVLDEQDQKTLSAVKSVVSRGGIEPPTRRLRVCCSAN
jgi:integrase